MELRTLDHLRVAARNQDIAGHTLHNFNVPGSAEPPYEWVAVISFYSAVHFVNALIWEKRGTSPTSHKQRDAYVEREAALANVVAEYSALESAARSARYSTNFRIDGRDCQFLLDSLGEIQKAVSSALQP